MPSSKSLATVLIYTTVAILLLLLLSSHSPSRSHHSHHRHRRLKLRPATSAGSIPNAPHAPIPFDPLISDIQQRREHREWEREHFEFDHHEDDAAPGHESQPEWKDFMNAEDYINDDERFNVIHRIAELFPRIDVSPADAHVSADELAQWNLQQAMREVMHRTKRDMELHDKNKDGFVSFKEFEPPSWASSFQDSNVSSDMGGWREEHFNASDVDADGLLNLMEFNDFQHPADSTNPKLIHWLCKEEIRERDKDKDGKLNFQEYFNGLFDSLRNYDEVHNESDTSETTPAKKIFQDLDQDKDGCSFGKLLLDLNTEKYLSRILIVGKYPFLRFLSSDELKPVIGTLHPSEHYYANSKLIMCYHRQTQIKTGG